MMTFITQFKRVSTLLLISVIYQEASSNCILNDPTPETIPCSEDWFLFGDKCYKVGGGNIGLTWEQASVYCSQEQGSLVTIRSQELQDYLVVFLLLDVQTNVWIGLNDRAATGDFVWADGSVFDYSNSDLTAYKSSRGRHNDCVQMQYFSSNVGSWDVTNCLTKQAYICQKNKRVRRKNLDPRFCSMEDGCGWKHSNSCYHIVSEEKTWEEAEQHCQTIGGHLATILDRATKEFFIYISGGYLTGEQWIGLKLQPGIQPKWTTGWRLNLHLWGYPPLQSFNEIICVAMGNDGSLVKADCSRKYLYICEITTDKPPIEDDWECPDLSDDWKNVNGEFCYLLETNKQHKWFEANYECMRKGGALVSLHSRKEAADLYSLTKYIYIDDLFPGSVRAFIGLHRNFVNKELFEWIDGSEMVYQNWHETEPNNILEECVELFTSNMKWNDYPCDSTSHFICSARKVRPKVTLPENEVYAIQTVPPVTDNDEVEEKHCICPICSTVIDETQTENIDSILTSSTKSVGGDLILYEEELNTGGTVYTQNEESFETTTSYFEKPLSETSNEFKPLPEISNVFIELSTITPEGFKEENLFPVLLKGKDLKISEVMGSPADLTKLTKEAEERALILRQKTEQHELIMRLIKDEYELRMIVLYAQLKVLKQISEELDQNPKAINLIL